MASGRRSVDAPLEQVGGEYPYQVKAEGEGECSTGVRCGCRTHHNMSFLLAGYIAECTIPLARLEAYYRAPLMS
jgi:hypothetical protein